MVFVASADVADIAAHHAAIRALACLNLKMHQNKSAAQLRLHQDVHLPCFYDRKCTIHEFQEAELWRVHEVTRDFLGEGAEHAFRGSIKFLPGERCPVKSRLNDVLLCHINSIH